MCNLLTCPPSSGSWAWHLAPTQQPHSPPHFHLPRPPSSPHCLLPRQRYQLLGKLSTKLARLPALSLVPRLPVRSVALHRAVRNLATTRARLELRALYGHVLGVGHAAFLWQRKSDASLACLYRYWTTRLSSAEPSLPAAAKEPHAASS